MPGNGPTGKAPARESSDGLPLPRRFVAIGAISAGTALTIIDGGIATVALPTIATDLQVGSSAVVSVISADDLTSVAANLQSQTFRSFEIYIVVALIYLALAMAFSALFRLMQRRFLSYPDRR